MSKARCRLCSSADRLIHLFDSRLNNAEKLRRNISVHYNLNVHSCELDFKYACVKCCLKAIDSSKRRETSTATDKCQSLISPGELNKVHLPRDEALKQRPFRYSGGATKLRQNQMEEREDSTIPSTAVELFKNMRSKAQVVLDQVAPSRLLNSTLVGKEVVEIYEKIDSSKSASPPISDVNTLDQTRPNLMEKAIALTSDNSITELQSKFSAKVSKRRRSSSESSEFPVAKKKALLLVPYTIKLECTYCGQSFHRESRLNRHMKQHSKCIVCQKTHQSDDALFKHLKDVCHKRVEANQPILQLERINEDASVVLKYKETFSFYSLLACKDKHEIQSKNEPEPNHLNSSTDKNGNEDPAVADCGKDVQIATVERVCACTFCNHKSNTQHPKDDGKIARKLNHPNRNKVSYGFKYPYTSTVIGQNHKQLYGNNPTTSVQYNDMTHRHQIPEPVKNISGHSDQTVPITPAQNVVAYSFSECATEKVASYAIPTTWINANIGENFNNAALSQGNINFQQANQSYLAPSLYLLGNMINMVPATNNAQQVDLPCRIRVKSPWELNRI